LESRTVAINSDDGVANVYEGCCQRPESLVNVLSGGCIAELAPKDTQEAELNSVVTRKEKRVVILNVKEKEEENEIRSGGNICHHLC